jgi:hypothetical protein
VDSVSLIIAALIQGAAAGLTDTVSSSVKDAYAALKSRLRRHVTGHRDAEQRLDELDRRPDTDLGPLAERLRQADAAADTELLQAARALLEQADPGGFRAGKYDVRISGGKGIVVGDHANVTMSFGDDD